jgi:hypothetical protein
MHLSQWQGSAYLAGDRHPTITGWTGPITQVDAGTLFENQPPHCRSEPEDEESMECMYSAIFGDRIADSGFAVCASAWRCLRESYVPCRECCGSAMGQELGELDALCANAPMRRQLHELYDEPNSNKQS